MASMSIFSFRTPQSQPARIDGTKVAQFSINIAQNLAVETFSKYQRARTLMKLAQSCHPI